MGCPVRKIVKQSGCAALIGEPTLAREIVLATKEAADVPVSVKTRTGLREAVTESWIGTLLETEPAAIILHGRTQKQMSKAPADWLEIARAGLRTLLPARELAQSGDRRYGPRTQHRPGHRAGAWRLAAAAQPDAERP